MSLGQLSRFLLNLYVLRARFVYFEKKNKLKLL